MPRSQEERARLRKKKLEWINRKKSDLEVIFLEVVFSTLQATRDTMQALACKIFKELKN